MKRFIDIGANLTDAMYQGIYNGSTKHQPDLANVLERAWNVGLKKIIITAGRLEETQEALKLVKTDEERLFTTVGVHPTRCGAFDDSGDPERHLNALRTLIEQNRRHVVAVGECGLDYDRLQFCDRDTQRRYFERQLSLSESSKLPLFLHCRASAADLVDVLRTNAGKCHGGVVHSFDGSTEEAEQIMALGYHIGINGCSLKTAENLSVAAALPADRLLLETDAPWCEVRPTHAGSAHLRPTPADAAPLKKERWQPDRPVKGRNEPANITQVLDVLAGVREEDADALAEQVYANTMRLFFPNEV
ncbi:putative deoxyribonuclease TATDN1 [Amphibalanus amphitrite]|uniref:Deoxyribonuclease TATDN1 n=1 Tax=Amphibalanus amphitrite TaxID=1232801 RepID=A0A6A4W2G8_AMPAM|nr:putative deoxyribonuclease TATDN1 [Amphibalanus amphitrite]XP_043239548.1 putative deoxyribonuclease TATDN1 [Amphibalanus amphitrite]XP_043239549.1 putative deoxyribonuclease TATDN1 [Amphibalanus amphitrite]XP_043239550.1 putative deoxyribonuclease TATDN1 [Amphibalanus amphitrite]XP_043239551.1 putative deoxyribonuclease TATDN1 [Amphibalanus amphitrite]KAF0300625.1 putative deoxyribonuclease TATDN1 [Amphibalanus amphitrite]KAF0300626.1 putative deoxyribonuclease TATDN1 [Amphibalanus amphit